MKVICFAILLLGTFVPQPLVSDTQTDLPPLPPRGENFSEEEWVTYGRTVLEILYPDDEEISYIHINVTASPLAIASSTNQTSPHVILFTKGFAESLRSSLAFATVMAHERGHLRQTKPKKNTFRHVLKKEVKADKESMRALRDYPLASCSLSQFLRDYHAARLAEGYEFGAAYFRVMGTRLARLDKQCGRRTSRAHPTQAP